MWSALQSDLEISFQQSLDIFIGGILSQSCLEVLQLVQKSIQTLTELETPTRISTFKKTALKNGKVTAEE